ncbi:B12-binding domain-containing radical SAM protein [Limisalsivibrio acetivorans]|uniref:B12-binding domain-containing radical SAM protein n=1 Tax=Limisalsivibrio acetivorans TaxID=1304888 RepID=UPI0003B67BB5|nr:B12-binding domain-containing radical SAM protein [Limisalsivibrio acetivorans]
MRILMLLPDIYMDSTLGFPLGALYICSVLRDDGNDVRLELISSSNARYDTLTALEKHAPEAICVSAIVTEFTIIREILKTCRAHSPDALRVLGGALLSSRPELIMENTDADIGIIGEGEITASKLFKCIKGNDDFEDVRGIIYRKDGSMFKTPSRELIQDLDSIPFPAHDLIDYGRYLSTRPRSNFMYFSAVDNPRTASIITSRSCPYLCTFCYHPMGRGTYRKRSMDNVFEEIDYLVKNFGINFLYLSDDMFSANRERVLEFCRRIREYGINWYAQMRIQAASGELLTAMYDSGCITVGYGVESINPDVLKSMKKKSSKERIEKALDLTIKNRIFHSGLIIFGDPAETFSMAQESIEWVRSNPQYNIAVTPILAYPASEDYLYAVEKGFITDEIEHIEKECPPVNFSRMDDKEYRDIFIEGRNLWQRINTSKESFSFNYEGNDGEDFIYTVKSKCPACSEESVYKGFRAFALTNTNYSPIEKFVVMCKHCRQRVDILPMWIPHIEAAYLESAESLNPILEKLAAEKTPVALTPFIHEKALENMNSIYSLEGLNIVSVMDSNSFLHGYKYLNKAVVTRQNKTAYSALPENTAVVVLPTGKRKMIEEIVKGFAAGNIINLLPEVRT